MASDRVAALEPGRKRGMTRFASSASSATMASTWRSSQASMYASNVGVAVEPWILRSGRATPCALFYSRVA